MYVSVRFSENYKKVLSSKCFFEQQRRNVNSSNCSLRAKRKAQWQTPAIKKHSLTWTHGDDSPKVTSRAAKISGGESGVTSDKWCTPLYAFWQKHWSFLESHRSDIPLVKSWLGLLIAAQNSFGYLQCSCWNVELLGGWLNVTLASEMEEGTFDEWALEKQLLTIAAIHCSEAQQRLM